MTEGQYLDLSQLFFQTLKGYIFQKLFKICRKPRQIQQFEYYAIVLWLLMMFIWPSFTIYLHCELILFYSILCDTLKYFHNQRLFKSWT